MRFAKKSCVALLTLLLTFSFAVAQDELAEPVVSRDSLIFEPNIQAESFTLLIAGPDGFFLEQTFSGDELPMVSYNQLLASSEGLFSFLLTAQPILSSSAERALAEARESGETLTVSTLRDAGWLPNVSLVLNGFFRLEDGEFYVPFNDETVVSQDGELVDQDIPTRDIVHNDDVIITFSLCVGNDCVNGESFGFDTFRLKENNLRIHFNDTSTSASFPSNDWRIVINDSSNGGDNYFAVEDSTAGRQVFRVDAGAPANSLYVDSGGDVGMGTSTPVVEAHIADGDTPTIRLEQNGSSGFTAQTWDIAGNEAGFFVRDVTNGSNLSLRIRPGAPASSIDVAANGDVGFYTSSPSESLHVRRTDGTATLLVEEASSSLADRDLLRLVNNGGSRLLFEDTGASTIWKLNNRNSNGSFQITLDGSGGSEFVLDNVGNLEIRGSLTEMSDVNSKENFDSVDPVEVLEKVNNLPITTWNYKRDEDSTRHLGPMAQDFAAAFGLGKDETRISPRDVGSVALVSIQALNAKVEEKDQRIDELEKQNRNLQNKLDRIEALLEQLVDKK